MNHIVYIVILGNRMELFLVTNLIALTFFYTTFDHRLSLEDKSNQEIIMTDDILDYVASRDSADVIEILSDSYTWFGFRDLQSVIDSTHRWNGDLCDNELYKVLRVENKVVGLIMYTYYPDLNSSHINRLAVHKDFCNKGYASQLLQYSIDDIRSRGISYVHLHCRRQNEKALGLYEKKFNFHINMPDWLNLTLNLS